MTIATSVTSVVVTVLWQRCTQLCCDSSGPDSTVTAMAATLVCQRCKLTTVQQRWQWQHCNITAYTSVTAMTTDSAVTAVSNYSAVTAMLTLVRQHCAHHYECSGNWQRCHTNVHTVISALSLPVLLQRLCSFSLSQRCAHRRLSAVGFRLCRYNFSIWAVWTIFGGRSQSCAFLFSRPSWIFYSIVRMSFT